MTVRIDAVDELRRAAERRRELAKAYERKAEKLSHEARQMSLVASRISKQRGAADDAAE